MTNQSRLRTGLQRGATLVRVECAFLEEAVAPPCSLARRLRDQFLHDLPQPFAAVQFRRHRVQRQQRGQHLAAHAVSGGARDAQQAQLLVDAQAISGLDLDGGDAAAHEAAEPVARAGHQLLIGSRARGLDGAADSSAPLRDLQIGRSRQSLRVLARAVAGEDQVRVGIDQSRSEQAALPIDPLAATRRCARAAHVGDAIAIAGDRAVLDDRERPLVLACLRPRHRRNPRVFDDQHQRVRPGICTPRSRATWMASSYPASAWRRTPIAGSLVNTRSSRFAAAGVPSATITWPACSEYPMPTPPP